MEWTNETIARLQELWQQGLSTAEIGRQLEITKNAVVGKAHRLGLPPRPSPIRAGSKAVKSSPVGEKPARKVSKSEDELKSSAQKAAPAEKPKSTTSARTKSGSTPQDKAVEKKASLKSTANEGSAGHRDTTTKSAEDFRKVSNASEVTGATGRDVDGSQRPSEAQAAKPLTEKELRPLLRPLNVDRGVRRGPSCCWPFGDPGTPEFRFCGAKPVPGKPYCAEHCAVAYVKLRDRRDNSGQNSGG